MGVSGSRPSHQKLSEKPNLTENWPRKLIVIGKPPWIPPREGRILFHTDVAVIDIDPSHLERFAEVHSANVVVVFIDFEETTWKQKQQTYESLFGALSVRVKHAAVYLVAHCTEEKSDCSGAQSYMSSVSRALAGKVLNTFIYSKASRPLIFSTVALSLFPLNVMGPVHSLLQLVCKSSDALGAAMYDESCGATVCVCVHPATSSHMHGDTLCTDSPQAHSIMQVADLISQRNIFRKSLEMEIRAGGGNTVLYMAVSAEPGEGTPKLWVVLVLPRKCPAGTARANLRNARRHFEHIVTSTTRTQRCVPLAGKKVPYRDAATKAFKQVDAKTAAEEGTT